jgi:hypothetical protein
LSKTITFVSGQHVSANPRVWKSANFLDSMGYKVNIFTTWYAPKLLEEDLKLLSASISYQSSFTLTYSWRNFFQIVMAKVLRKATNYLYLFFRISSIYQEVYLPGIQVKKILSTPTDLFICHQETGLLLGVELMKRGHPVAFDFEDWYAEDYPNAFRSSGLFKKYEAYALKHALYVTCPSESLSRTYQYVYQVQQPVKVIYNSFPIPGVKKNHKMKSQSSMVWFSQTIGPNRGIEAFLEIIKTIDSPVELHFVGKVSAQYSLFLSDSLSETPHLLYIHQPMSHADLLDFVAQFPIGLALENHHPPSRNLTITNKILVYLQLNMQVIATDTTGHLELKSSFPESIAFIRQSEITQSTITIKKLLTREKSSITNEMKQYDWSVQEEKLKSLVDNALNTIQ